MSGRQNLNNLITNIAQQYFGQNSVKKWLRLLLAAQIEFNCVLAADTVSRPQSIRWVSLSTHLQLAVSLILSFLSKHTLGNQRRCLCVLIQKLANKFRVTQANNISPQNLHSPQYVSAESNSRIILLTFVSITYISKTSMVSIAPARSWWISRNYVSGPHSFGREIKIWKFIMRS